MLGPGGPTVRGARPGDLGVEFPLARKLGVSFEKWWAWKLSAPRSSLP